MTNKLSLLGLLGLGVFLAGCDTRTKWEPYYTKTPAAQNANGEPQKLVHVTMETTMGTIKLDLYPDKAPNTVANFVKLAQAGFYDGVLFHRVIPGFMAQTGDPNSKGGDPYKDGTGGPGYQFADELDNDLSNVRGTVAMANSGPNTNGSQFFINVANNTFLDHHYSIFGRVTDGMSVADQIVNVPTRHDDPRLKDRPVKDVRITKVTVE